MTSDLFLFEDPEQNRLNSFVYRRYASGTIKHPSNNFCAEKGSDPQFLKLILQAFEDETTFPEKDLLKFPKETIVEYLQLTHRLYLNVMIPELDQLFAALIRQADLGTPIALQLYGKFMEYSKELHKHIAYEEKTLFPLILKDAEKAKYLVNSILESAHHQHEDELSEILKDLMHAAARFEGIMPYGILLEKLRMLNRDLVVHAQVEDRVLMR